MLPPNWRLDLISNLYGYCRRKYRLDKLRELFYTIYFANIGRSKEHGKFGAFLQRFSRKVGLSTMKL